VWNETQVQIVPIPQYDSRSVPDDKRCAVTPQNRVGIRADLKRE
jgi:hypothetical protein